MILIADSQGKGNVHQMHLENDIFSSSPSNVDWGTVHISTLSLGFITHSLFHHRGNAAMSSLVDLCSNNPQLIMVLLPCLCTFLFHFPSRFGHTTFFGQGDSSKQPSRGLIRACTLGTCPFGSLPWDLHAGKKSGVKAKQKERPNHSG